MLTAEKKIAFEDMQVDHVVPLRKGGTDTLENMLPACRRKEEYLTFSVSEYLSRMEEALLDILERLEPIDKTIVLWWGLDGLRLNEDGTTEWVSRKRKPVETVSYQPCQSIQPWTDQTQSARARIDALMAQSVAVQAQSFQSMRDYSMTQQFWSLAGTGGTGGSRYYSPFCGLSTTPEGVSAGGQSAIIRWG